MDQNGVLTGSTLIFPGRVIRQLDGLQDIPAEADCQPYRIQWADSTSSAPARFLQIREIHRQRDASTIQRLYFPEHPTDEERAFSATSAYVARRKLHPSGYARRATGHQGARQLSRGGRGLQGASDGVSSSTRPSRALSIPSMRLPLKFRILEFKTYEGTTDPRHHLRHYRGKMLQYWEYEELVIHSFQDNLVSTPFWPTGFPHENPRSKPGLLFMTRQSEANRRARSHEQ
ncbi:hypothetical protein CRG98_009133 [Punica granatum]|uniref:Uncharacterized protein n=1 Tax=Punica granatum TaxID=22663 RepID=A0A2I0KQ70_PUNGR|nr:hypothetical protein CRG98_009133 [Punica granatum]